MSDLAARAPTWATRLSANLDRLLVLPLLLAAILASVAGGLAGTAAFVCTAVIAIGLARAVATAQDRTFILRLTVGSLALRAIVASILDLHLRGLNQASALFYDDSAYVNFGRMLAAYWAGDLASLPSDPSMRNTYVLIVGSLFSLIGPVIVVPRLLNGLLLTVAVLLTYRTMRALGLPGARWSSLLLAIFPSTALWSVIVLKDTYVLAAAVIAVWSVSEFLRSRNYLWWAATILALVAVESARKYVFIVLVLAWPLALVLSAPRGHRIRSAVVAGALCAAMLAVFRPFDVYNTGTFVALAQIRANMALGARTAFVDPMATVHVAPGHQFIVTATGATPVPDPQVIVVPIGAHLVLDSAGVTASPHAAVPAGAQRVLVRPGDRVVVVASVEPSASVGPLPPSSQLEIVTLRREAPNVVGTPAPNAAEDSLAIQRGILENLGYLPVGLFHVLVSPFPLAARSLPEIATVPEMAIWYAALILGAFGATSLLRAGDRGYAYGILVLGAIGLILSLAEGNAGTLIRHRAMMIPFVLVLAGVGIEHVLSTHRAPRSR